MFKKLKSLFVIEEAVSTTSDEIEVSGTQSTSSENDQSEESEKPDYSIEPPHEGKVDEKFLNRLLGAIEESNVDGFDYLEYKQALQNLSGINMEEITKYQSSLAMAKTMGASSESLIKSAQHYLDVLKKEENKFLEAFRNQMQRHIDINNNELKSLELSISNKRRQIEQLEKDIKEESKQLELKTKAIEKSKNKVESTKVSFYHAYHVVVEQIKDDLEKMKKYLNI